MGPARLLNALSDFQKKMRGEATIGLNKGWEWGGGNEPPRKRADAKLSVEKERDAPTELGEVNKSPPLSCKQSL